MKKDQAVWIVDHVNRDGNYVKLAPFGSYNPSEWHPKKGQELCLLAEQEARKNELEVALKAAIRFIENRSYVSQSLRTKDTLDHLKLALSGEAER